MDIATALGMSIGTAIAIGTISAIMGILITIAPLFIWNKCNKILNSLDDEYNLLTEIIKNQSKEIDLLRKQLNSNTNFMRYIEKKLNEEKSEK